MMKNPLISIIVPVYKVEQYLDRCVKSLLEQTYANIEIILVDDGSPDKCPELCDKYAKEHSNIHAVHKTNGGLASARNAGVAYANGEYIAFVDSDDWVSHDTYEYMLSLIEKYDAEIADIACIQVQSENEAVHNIKEVVEDYEGNDKLRHYLARGMSEKKGAPYSACRKLYKAKLFSTDKPFDEGIVNEDICFNFKMTAKAKRIVVSNQIKYFYFQGNASITSGKLKHRDLDLLTVSNQLVELATATGDEQIIELAKLKQARSDFSILARISVAGIDESVKEPQELINRLQKNLRKNLWRLVKSTMPLSRKVLAVVYVVNFNLSCKLMKLVLRHN